MSLREAIKELVERDCWDYNYVSEVIADLQNTEIGTSCVAWCMLLPTVKEVITVIKQHTSRRTGVILEYLYRGKWCPVEMIDAVNPETIYRIRREFKLTDVLEQVTQLTIDDKDFCGS